MPSFSDILVIGAGITGCAVARELSRYSASVRVLEAADDVAEGATKANSGIIHAGFDAHPGTLKARFNVEGAAMYPELSRSLRFPYIRNGALVLGFTDRDFDTLNDLLERGRKNGVSELRIIHRDEIIAMEPNVNPEVRFALFAPGSAIVSPYNVAFALADDAAFNGVSFVFNSPATALSFGDDRLWHASTPHCEYTSKILVNCAGASSAELHNMICPQKPYRIIHRRGQYCLLGHLQPAPFTRTMFQCPTEMGKGILVSPTAHGNVIIGPSAEDIGDPADTSTTMAGLRNVLEGASITWPEVQKAARSSNITNFSGIRAHEQGDDFVIGAVPGCAGAYETVGIESPGLSSAPAIAKALSEQIATENRLSRKDRLVPYQPMPKPFNEMTDKEREDALKADPLNGNIICRCEVVTEAEIRAAIRRPVGARSIDGVKRRTRAGMGRCQGGFCSPRVAAILAEELGVPLSDITKNGEPGRLLTGTVQEALKQAGGDHK